MIHKGILDRAVYQVMVTESALTQKAVVAQAFGAPQHPKDWIWWEDIFRPRVVAAYRILMGRA